VGDSLPNAEVARGAVLAQSPLPGYEVPPGSSVRVIVSSGRLRPTVPDVEAMPVALATRALQAAGFDVLLDEAPGEGEVGRVVSIEPHAGTAVELPASVRVRVGAALAAIETPAVIGMREASAREAIEAAGLQVREVVYEVSEFGERGGVVAQEPAPGVPITPGSGVLIRVTSPDGAGFTLHEPVRLLAHREAGGKRYTR
jgi:eukaryotic-like serine/threonine-protein kinase